MFHSKVVFFIFSFLLPKKLITQERKRMVITIINQGETKKRSKGQKRQKKGEGAKEHTKTREPSRQKKERKNELRVICDYSPFYKYYFYDDDDSLGE
jgi:hypothetical protein